MATLTDDDIDALDSFSLHWGAPRGRESVRLFARAVIAASTNRTEPAPALTDDMVDRALTAFLGSTRVSAAAKRDALPRMRAALTTALAAQPRPLPADAGAVPVGEDRFFLDHDTVHDRVTGLHVHGDRSLDAHGVDRELAALNELARAAREAERAAQAPAASTVPMLFEVLQRHTRFFAGELKIQRKNGQSLCWIMWNEVCVGKIENATVVIFGGRIKGDERAALEARIVEFEANPLAAAKKYGKLSGTCCSCGRDLTHDGSIEAGIGPICAGKFEA